AAIPRQPVPLHDAVLELKALQDIQFSEAAKSFSTQDSAALYARLGGDGTRPGARAILEAGRDKLLNHREVTWYGRYAHALHTDDRRQYDAAYRVVETVYGAYRNTFPHDDFNKLRAKVDRNKSTALKEAVEELLDAGKPISIDTEFAQSRGD